jgi:hypothetical protein
MTKVSDQHRRDDLYDKAAHAIRAVWSQEGSLQESRRDLATNSVKEEEK